jgi:putative membrane protein insertion efficiency factor
MKIPRTLPVMVVPSFLLLFAGIAAPSYDPFKGPWEENARKTFTFTREPSLNPLNYLVKLFRDHISPIDGHRCPMYPTCSQYSIECFEKHGFFIGWLMTCDRLFHEADEMKQAPLIWVHDRYKFCDPVENNDFWWYDNK